LNGNRIYCSNSTCITKSGSRTPGNNECCAKLCLGCCRSSTARALDTGIGRSRCQPHKQPQVFPQVVTQPLAASVVPIPQAIPGVVSQPQAVPGVPSQAIPQEHLPLPNQPLNRPSPGPPPEPTQPRRRPLAQPIAPAWANSQAAAEQEKISIKSLKIQQHEMDERRKRTCILIIYHTVRDLFFHLLRHLLTNVGISRAVNLLYELINISQHSHIFVSQHAPSLSMTLNYQPPAVLISGKVNG